MLASLGAKVRESSRKLISLRFFGLQSLARLFNQRVRLLNFFALLLAFSFGNSNIVSGTFDQFVQFLGPLPIELDSISMRINLALKMLEFTAAARNSGIDLFQSVALLGQLVFVRFDFGASQIFRFAEARNLSLAMGEIRFELLELLARIMRIKDAKIVVQCLVTPCFARLALQRTDLTFYFLNDVANAQEICIGRFQLA